MVVLPLTLWIESRLYHFGVVSQEAAYGLGLLCGLHLLGFPIAFLGWAAGMPAALPLWEALCRRGNPGPKIAAALGAVLPIGFGWYAARICGSKAQKLCP